jgi:hypothetical protein
MIKAKQLVHFLLEGQMLLAHPSVHVHLIIQKKGFAAICMQNAQLNFCFPAGDV